MALTHPGWAVLVVLLVAATGPVAAADIAPAHQTPTADATLPTTATPFDDTTNTTEETTDDTTNTTEETTNSTNETLDSTDETTSTTNDATNDVTDETTETADGATETVDDTTNTTGETVEDAADDTTNTTEETVDDTTETVDETADTVDDTEETTDEVEGVLSDDGSGSVELSSGSDSDLLLLNAAAATGSEDDADAGGAGGGGDDGDGGDGDGAGGDGGEADTSVWVETESQQPDPVSRVLAAAWETMAGVIPEDAPVGPAAATGVGALALLAVASRQWFVQSTASGMPTLLSSGVPGQAGDWVEKLKRLAVPLRYSRYDDSDPLEHDTRRTLHDAIEASPGINLTTLAARTDVPLSTARHHVRVLADENLVSTAKRHGKRRYYPTGADDVELADALSEPPKAAVLHALAHHGEAHVGLLADGLDRDPSTVTHHLQALADDGLVEREKRGRTVVNRLSGSARSTLGGDDRATGDYAELSAKD